jgi:hypothetical protein
MSCRFEVLNDFSLLSVLKIMLNVIVVLFLVFLVCRFIMIFIPESWKKLC